VAQFQVHVTLADIKREIIEKPEDIDISVLELKEAAAEKSFNAITARIQARLPQKNFSNINYVRQNIKDGGKLDFQTSTLKAI